MIIHRVSRWLPAAFLLLLTPTVLFGLDSGSRDLDYAQVERLRMVLRSDGTWDIHVTVLHRDQGWDHYADVWQLVDDESGEVLAERVLAHPHDDEQPFTRSLSRMNLMLNGRKLRIRAGCNRHGFGGRELTVEIPERTDMGIFSVIRE